MSECGNSLSQRLQYQYRCLATSEVQAVVFTRVQGDNYTIRCVFLNGSEASECVYVLLSEKEGVENITGTIERNSSGVYLEVVDIGCYTEVLVYVNTSGALPLSIKIDSDKLCPISTGKTTVDTSNSRTISFTYFTIEPPSNATLPTVAPSKAVFTLPIIITVAGGGLLVVIVLLVLFLVCVTIACKKCNHQFFSHTRIGHIASMHTSAGCGHVSHQVC